MINIVNITTGISSRRTIIYKAINVNKSRYISGNIKAQRAFNYYGVFYKFKEE